MKSKIKIPNNHDTVIMSHVTLHWIQETYSELFLLIKRNMKILISPLLPDKYIYTMDSKDILSQLTLNHKDYKYTSEYIYEVTNEKQN